MADAGGHESVEMISEAMGLDGTVTKTGYMHKTAMSGSAAWRKRYFVLNGHQLLYYADHKNLAQVVERGGDFTLTADCYIEDCAKIGDEHVFEVHSGTHTLRMSARTAEERARGRPRSTRVSDVTDTTRATCSSRSRASSRRTTCASTSCSTPRASRGTRRRRTRTASRARSSSRRTTPPSCARTATLEIKLSGHAGAAERVVLRCPDKVEAKWLEAIEATIAKLGERDDLIAKQLGEGQNNNEQIMVDGYLATRPEGAKGAAARAARGRSSSTRSPARRCTRPRRSSRSRRAVYLVSPTCSVFETNLNAHAFELVTTQGVLHLYGATSGRSKRWVGLLRDAIRDSTGLVSDPLLRAAQKLQPSTYDVRFEVKQPLGIVLERAAEWALVKIANGGDGGGGASVTEGSALVAVNGQSTMLQPYQQTIKSLTGWKPPLALRFIRAPAHRGWLKKQARGQHSARNWRKRFFELKEGKLSYFESDPATKAAPAAPAKAAGGGGGGDAAEKPPGSHKGTVQLMGSAVRVARDEIGAPFCLKLVSGIMTLIMQAEHVEEMMAWATQLYLAIAVATAATCSTPSASARRRRRRSARCARPPTTPGRPRGQARAESVAKPRGRSRGSRARAREEAERARGLGEAQAARPRPRRPRPRRRGATARRAPRRPRPLRRAGAEEARADLAAEQAGPSSATWPRARARARTRATVTRPEVRGLTARAPRRMM